MRGTFSEATCPTPGCGRPVRSAYWTVGKWCHRCRQRVRRQGDARQEPVRRHEPRKTVTRLKRVVKRLGKVEVVERAFRQIAGNLLTVTVDDLPQPVPNGKAKPWTNLWMRRALEGGEPLSGQVEG